MTERANPAGWYHAEGDGPGTVRYWDGTAWSTGPLAGPDGAHSADGADLPSLGRTLAPPGGRIVARLIDAIICVAAFVVVWVGALLIEFVGDAGILVFLVILLLIFGFALFYEIAFVAMWGATPGKILLGYEVIGENGESPPGIGRAVRRWLPNLASAIPILGTFAFLGIAGLSILFLFSDDRRQTIYDRLAGTYVVRKR